MKKTRWTAGEDQLLREWFPHEPTARVAIRFGLKINQVQNRAKRLGLYKTAEYLASVEACRLRRGDNIGARYRFRKGHAPANKGLRRPGWAAGRMRETQFRKGQKPCTWMPIGSTRMMDGYLQRKVTDTGYPPRDWRPEHVLIWQRVNGLIPAGHCLKFKDGNKEHIALDNLELISRADLMRRNSVHNLPKELTQVIQLRGALLRQLRRKGAYGHEEQNAGPAQPSL